MKKLFLTCFLLIGFIIAGNTDVMAQQGEFKLGGGLLFGSEVESLGIQINGVYRFTEEISAAADVGVFFPGDNTGLDSWWDINVNGHYNLADEDEYRFYGLAGLNVTTISVGSFNDSELGLNLGAGGEYHLDSVSLFGEIKYIISDLDQLVLGAGARVPLN